MASKILTWITDEHVQNAVLSYDTFLSLTDRTDGFKSGTAAYAKYVNSGLRQANLVISAMMNVIAPDSNLDLTSPLQTAIDTISNAHPFNINVKNSTGQFSIAQQSCEAVGVHSSAFGEGTHASANDQMAVGKYNDQNADCAFLVGNGTDSENKSNAFGVRHDGSAFVNGRPNSDNDVLRWKDVNLVTSTVKLVAETENVSAITTMPEGSHIRQQFGVTHEVTITFPGIQFDQSEQYFDTCGRKATIYFSQENPITDRSSRNYDIVSFDITLRQGSDAPYVPLSVNYVRDNNGNIDPWVIMSRSANAVILMTNVDFSGPYSMIRIPKAQQTSLSYNYATLVVHPPVKDIIHRS